MTPDAPSPDRQRQKITEFMQLLPLTLAVAGLPDGEHGKYFNEGQLEVRATIIRNAYKHARQLLLDLAKADQGKATGAVAPTGEILRG